MKEPKTAFTGAALTAAMKQQLEQLAQAEQRSEAQIVRRALAAYLSKYGNNVKGGNPCPGNNG